MTTLIAQLAESAGIPLRGKPRPRDAAPPDRRPPVAAGFDDMDRWQA